MGETGKQKRTVVVRDRSLIDDTITHGYSSKSQPKQRNAKTTIHNDQRKDLGRPSTKKQKANANKVKTKERCWARSNSRSVVRYPSKATNGEGGAMNAAPKLRLRTEQPVYRRGSCARYHPWLRVNLTMTLKLQ
jgi:hypothetical protein